MTLKNIGTMKSWLAVNYYTSCTAEIYRPGGANFMLLRLTVYASIIIPFYTASS